MAKRILVVDDEVRITALVATRLLANGYLVMSANSAEEALAQARKGRPDAFVADINMPGMDGGEMASEVAGDPRLAGIPIIFLSALVSRPDFTSRAADHQYFLPKPLIPADLLAGLERILG